MTDRTQPDSASTKGAAHIIRYALELGLLWIDGSGRDKVREALDALDTLEAQLEAIGAGGVSGPLIGRASLQPPGFDAADMATAAAQGFRDGVASVAANAGSEPGASRAFLERALSAMEGVIDVADRNTTEFDALRSCVVDLTLMLFKPQACHHSPPEGMAGRLQVYRCKIKSRKQIGKEIPREQQGWWADVAAGQKLLLRQAVQSDIDRCTLGGKRSRNPDDYMCETQTHAPLVPKVAPEYMNPEENVVAAVPPPPTAAEGV